MSKEIEDLIYISNQFDLKFIEYYSIIHETVMKRCILRGGISLKKDQILELNTLDMLVNKLIA